MAKTEMYASLQNEQWCVKRVEQQSISSGRSSAIVNAVHRVEVLAQSTTKSRRWLPGVALLPRELTPTNSRICKVKLL